MAKSDMNPDTQIVRQLRIDLSNDPEKFTDWEHNFVDSLLEQAGRNGDGFGLTIKQYEVVERIQNKANQ